MNDNDQTSTEKVEKVLVEMSTNLYDYIENEVLKYDFDRKLMTARSYNLDALNRHLVLYSNRESKDNIKLDYKTLKKSKGLYDIRSLDFKIVEANDLDSLNLFYIDGRLCGWKKSKTGGKEIVEIKSEDDLKDFNKYDKRFKIIWTVVWGIITTLNVLVWASHYFIK